MKKTNISLHARLAEGANRADALAEIKQIAKGTREFMSGLWARRRGSWIFSLSRRAAPGCRRSALAAGFCSVESYVKKRWTQKVRVENKRNPKLDAKRET